MIKKNELKSLLKTIVSKYPKDLIVTETKDIDRIAFHINLVLERKGKDIAICDIGGGLGLFTIGCAALGMKAILVDDFKDPINSKYGDSVLGIHKSYGVEVISKDVLKGGLNLKPNSLDAVTSFESMEHWHHSPKKLFQELKEALKVDGLFILNAPNCLNLRKRITAPLGYYKWSNMQEWYEEEVFRGHVREPDVGDLIYIAKDLKLRNVEIIGRHWKKQGKPFHNFLRQVVDYPLRLCPSLCDNIYLVGNV